MEPGIILEKVSKASATRLNLKDRSDPVEHIGPVGTNYTRIQPAREINSVERESFWTQQQEEERRRKIEERKRLENERKKLEDVEKMRELQQAKEREQLLVQKERDLCRRREEEKNAENKARDLLEQRKLSTNDEDGDTDPEEERMRRAETMRQSRAQEARSLVAGRSPIQNARALFEQNSQPKVPVVPKPSHVVRGFTVSAARQQFMQKDAGSETPVASKVKAETPVVKQVAPAIPETSVSAVKSNGTHVPPNPVQVPEPQPAKVVDVATNLEHEVPDESLETHFVEDDDQSESDTELALQEEVLRRAVYNDIPITDHVLEDIQEESEGKASACDRHHKSLTSLCLQKWKTKHRQPTDWRLPLNQKVESKPEPFMTIRQVSTSSPSSSCLSLSLCLQLTRQRFPSILTTSSHTWT